MTLKEMADIHARGMTFSRSWRAEEFQDLLASPHCFATENQGAFAIGRAVADEAELLTIVTDPNHRRQGSGRAVLALFETEAKKRGAKRAFLEVSADNTAAIALYRSANWVNCGRRKSYYASSQGLVDAILMEKQL